MLKNNKILNIILEGEYRGFHKAPNKDYGSPLYDVTLNGTYPKDFYSPNGLIYYGGSLKWDKMVIAKIQSYKNNPNKNITIFRAVPNDSNISVINSGDWVTILKEYAIMHGDSALDGQYKIINMNVPANTLWTDGNSPYEWGYNP
jgi:hypothetical protein